MNTDHISALIPEITLEPNKLKDGRIRLLGESKNYKIEIIPDTSVAFLIDEIDKDILSILDYYSEDTQKSLNLLERAAKAVSENPNTKFRDNISGDLFLTYTKIAPIGGATLHLQIEEG
jgi:hypothetical protein